MSQICVTAAAGRRVPLPGGKVLTPGQTMSVEANDRLIYRLLADGDLVEVPAAPEPPAKPPAPTPAPSPVPTPAAGT